MEIQNDTGVVGTLYIEILFLTFDLLRLTNHN